MVNANNLVIEMVYMTHVCVSVRASTHPTLHTLLSSGGMHSHPTSSSEIPFRLFHLSQPPDPAHLRPNHKIDLLILPRQRSVKGVHQSLPHHDRVHYWR